MIAYITEEELQATVRELAEAYGWTVFWTWQCPAIEVYVWRPSDLDEIERILA